MGAKWEVSLPSFYAALVNGYFIWKVHGRLHSIVPYEAAFIVYFDSTRILTDIQLIVNLTTNGRRHYGALQGLDKQETVDKYGKEQVNVWWVGSVYTPSRHSTSNVLPQLTWTIESIWYTRRRSYDVPPPEVDLASTHFPGNDPMYMSNAEASLIKTESLKVRVHHTM